MLAQEANSSALSKDEADSALRDLEFPPPKPKSACCN